MTVVGVGVANAKHFSIGSIFVLAKEGNAEMLEHIKPTLNMRADAFSSDAVYDNTEIDTPFLTTKLPGAPMTPDQAKFQVLTDEVMEKPATTSILSFACATVRGRRPFYSDS